NPATAHRLTREAVALNRRLGDPTRAAKPAAKARSAAKRKQPNQALPLGWVVQWLIGDHSTGEDPMIVLLVPGLRARRDAEIKRKFGWSAISSVSVSFQPSASAVLRRGVIPVSR